MTEYGDPDNETDFENLYKYSPLHNVRVPAGSHQYPATMLTTGVILPQQLTEHACGLPPCAHLFMWDTPLQCRFQVQHRSELMFVSRPNCMQMN